MGWDIDLDYKNKLKSINSKLILSFTFIMIVTIIAIRFFVNTSFKGSFQKYVDDSNKTEINHLIEFDLKSIYANSDSNKSYVYENLLKLEEDLHILKELGTPSKMIQYIFSEEGINYKKHLNNCSKIMHMTEEDIDDLKENINKYPKSYWANTSSNSIVKSLIERADDITKGEIEALIEGKTIEKPVHEDITYDDVYDNLDNLWNFMFFTGYFKKISERMDENTQENFVELAIPNLEVKYIFRTKILKWFNEKIKSEDLSLLYTSIIKGEVDVFQREVNRLLKKTISFNDAYENFYHGFMIGLLSHMDGYIVKSNRETGDGRCDIYIKPLSIFDKAVIIEMKVCDKPKELFTKPQDALQQIEDKKYAYELNQSGYEDIIKYGMAFYRKDCIVKIKE